MSGKWGGARVALVERLEPRRLWSSSPVPAAVEVGPPPEIAYHLTARPWRPLSTPAPAYFDVVEGIARTFANYQDPSGRLVDPYENREVQYTTPYFAYAVGALADAGRARDLVPKGVAAMENATAQFAGGAEAIDNEAGEFYLPALMLALPLYEPHVPPETMQLWRQRMATPLDDVLRMHPNNWRTYAMRGAWLRARAGLADPAAARAFIEESWAETQAHRLEDDPQGLYHDTSSSPDAIAVDAVGRGNLLALIEEGYDGPSAARIRELVEQGARTSLYLQDPTGQAPVGGRASGHVWNDLVYQANFETMAAEAQSRGDARLAGEYRRAAAMAFQSLGRWRRPDGTFWITKNRFDPASRVGYQPASFFSNYNASLMFHLAELGHAAHGGQPAVAAAEQPAPSEVGGYVLATDPGFGRGIL